jgi:hypothetical protein
MASRKQIVRYPAWLPAGIAAIAFCIALQGYSLSDSNARVSPDPYMINVQPERLREAISRLPDRAVIGYLSDLDFAASSGQAAYFGVMYALAPRLLTRSADHAEWVVGNFSHPLDYAVTAAPHHLDSYVFNRKQKYFNKYQAASSS